MSDVVRMRTLTWKSVMGFGCNRQKNETIESLFIHGGALKIINSYFGLAKINYVDEVLSSVGITKDLRIKKPYKIACFDERKIKISEVVSNFNNMDYGYKIGVRKSQSIASIKYQENVKKSQRKVKFARSLSKSRLQMKNLKK